MKPLECPEVEAWTPSNTVSAIVTGILILAILYAFFWPRD